MNQWGRYLFEQREENGRVMPFSRMDIILAVILTFAIMILITLAFEPRTAHQPLSQLQRRNFVIAISVAVAILVLNGRRRMLFGVALSLVAMRFMFGIVFVNHGLPMVVITLLAGASAYLLLRDL